MSWPEALFDTLKNHKEVFTPTVAGFILWAVFELQYAAFSGPVPVGWDMVPPAAVVRLILFVGPGLLIGMAIHAWRSWREKHRVRAINSATFYVERPTLERLAFLESRLARLGIKGEIQHDDIRELIEYLDAKDIRGAAKRFPKTAKVKRSQEARNVIVPQTAPETMKKTLILFAEKPAELAGTAFEGQIEVVAIQVPTDVTEVSLEKTDSGWMVTKVGWPMRNLK